MFFPEISPMDTKTLPETDAADIDEVADMDEEEGEHKPKSDSWEDQSGSGTPATTPDDEEAEHFVPASKPRTKTKPKQEEALTTEKEHVNVVFIGHVGKLLSMLSGYVVCLWERLS